MTREMADTPPTNVPERVTITVLKSQLEALRDELGDELVDEELYSAAAIAVLLYIGPRAERALPGLDPADLGV